MANLSNVQITITANDQTGSGINSALSNVSRLSGGFSSVGSIAAGVFGGILGSNVFNGITRGIGSVVSSAFGLNNTIRQSTEVSASMVQAMSESESRGTQAFGGISKAASQYEKTMREIRERESDGLEDYAQKIDDIKQKILDAENEVAKKKEERLKKEKQQLEDLADSYTKTYQRINENIEDEMMSFEERMYDLENQKTDKLARLAEKRANKEEDITEEIADLNQDLLDATTAAEEEKIAIKIALLNEELAEFIAKNDAEKAQVEERMNHEIEFAQKKHDIKIARLKQKMEEEKAEYEKRKGRIEEDTKSDIANYQQAADEKVATLKKQLEREKQEHERFLRDISQAYSDAQAKLDSGGGGSTSKRTLDFQFDFADAFRESAGGLTSSGIQEYLDEVQKKYTEIGIKSPFSIGEIQQAGRAMIGFTGGSAENMESILTTIQALAVKNPMQGMQGAITSMVELLGSGNVTSMARRFDLPKDIFEGIDKAKNADELLMLLNERLAGVGVTGDLIRAKTATLGGAFENLTETFNVFTAMIVQPIYDKLTEGLINVNKWLADHDEQIEQVANTIGMFISEGATQLLDFFINFGQQLIEFWEGPGQNIVGWFQSIWDSSTTLVKPALELIQTIWTSVQKVLEETIIPGMGRIFDKIAVLWEQIAPEVKKTLEFLKQWWNENHEAIETTVKVVWAVIEGAISIAMDLIAGVIRVVLAALRGDWGAAWQAIKDTFVNVWNSMKSFVSNVWDAIGNTVKNGINGVIDRINGFVRGLNDKLGKTKVNIGGIEIGGWQIPEIPKLAEGGIVGKATLAMIGEAGPEAVIPLNKLKGGFGQGTVISVSVTGNNIIDDPMAETLADRVGDAITNKLGLQGRYLYNY